MRFATLAAAGVAALVLASTASAGPYTLTSTTLASGPSPFTGCTADHAADPTNPAKSAAPASCSIYS